MIEGLRFDVSAEEMKTHLAKKATHHQERSAFYRSQADALDQGGAEPAKFSGGDPIRALRDKEAQHTHRSEFFTFLKDHIIPGETYRLQENDLIEIEFISRGHAW